ncbi:MAG: VanZ family protein [Clostridia bacterium]|nr:VanZ family protein [Clostridia bacterium]
MNKKRTYILSVMTLLWTGFIFSMSLKVGEESGQLSGGILNIILDIISPLWENIFGPITAEGIEFFHHLIRKAAHFTEFLILGVLTYLLSLNFEKLKFKWLTALGYGTLIASLDETLQLFVEGRAGAVFDVCIDFCGAFTGIMLVALFIKIRGNFYGKGNRKLKEK